MDKPLLLVDVDGVISLFGFDPARPPSGRFQMVDGIAHYLSATAGAHLRALAERYELVWCTGWEEKANDYLPHALGLGTCLPHVSFDRTAAVGDAHWKLPAIDAYAGAERLVGVDRRRPRRSLPCLGPGPGRRHPARRHRPGDRPARGPRHEAAGVGSDSARRSAAPSLMPAASSRPQQ